MLGVYNDEPLKSVYYRIHFSPGRDISRCKQQQNIFDMTCQNNQVDVAGAGRYSKMPLFYLYIFFLRHH